ncbi:MAG: hypothetical protein ACI4VF_01060, partial [Lachnospirales bacterium]
RWCGRSVDKIIIYLLPDYDIMALLFLIINLILFYIFCRLYRYGMWWNTYILWYYISALCSVVIMIMTFSEKALMLYFGK